MPKRSRVGGRLALAAITIGLGAGPASTGPPAPVVSEFPDPTVDSPAQERFRDWPDASLRALPYWHHWGPQTLRKAELFGRPVLFVMAPRWSKPTQHLMDGPLAEPAVLRLLNETFIAILVNPDRRPDLRERYQSGFWPVATLLTPEGLPMLGTANPEAEPQPIIASPTVDTEGVLFMLQEGDKYWKRRSAWLVAAGQAWRAEKAPALPRPGSPSHAISDQLADWLIGSRDRRDGGFGLAPKYVLPELYAYAAHRRARDRADLESHARFTLERLLDSPLYDVVRGGAHRVAEGPQWSQIQYEKMLRPNAMLLRDLVVCARATGLDSLRDGVAATARFLRNGLGRDGGGFHHGQLADPETDDGGGYYRGEHDRPPPVDPLVLSGSTALAASAMLRGGWLLADDELRASGREALSFVLTRGYRRGRGVDHVLEPNPGQARLLWPQADAAFALVDAFEASGDRRFLDAAADIAEFAWNNLRAPRTTLLLDRLATPADLGLLTSSRHPIQPNVRLARALIRLGHHGAGKEARARGEAILQALGGSVAAYRLHGIEAALAIEELLATPLVIRVHGPSGLEATEALRGAALNAPYPWTIVTNGSPEQPPWLDLSFGAASERVARPGAVSAAAIRLTGWTIEEGT